MLTDDDETEGDRIYRQAGICNRAGLRRAAVHHYAKAARAYEREDNPEAAAAAREASEVLGERIADNL